MFKLALKDLKMSIKAMVLIMFYIVVFSTVALSYIDNLFVGVIYIMLMVMSIIVLVIYTNGYDNKNKTEVVLNSLPINRSDIVRGKYLSLIIYIIIVCGTLFLSSNVFKEVSTKFHNGQSVSMWNIIVATNIILLFYSIYYPIYFKVGEDIKTFNYVLWIFVFAGPSLIGKLEKRLETKKILDKIISIDFKKINIYFLIVSSVIFYISLQISKKVYQKREF